MGTYRHWAKDTPRGKEDVLSSQYSPCGYYILIISTKLKTNTFTTLLCTIFSPHCSHTIFPLVFTHYFPLSIHTIFSVSVHTLFSPQYSHTMFPQCSHTMFPSAFTHYFPSVFTHYFPSVFTHYFPLSIHILFSSQLSHTISPSVFIHYFPLSVHTLVYRTPVTQCVRCLSKIYCLCFDTTLSALCSCRLPQNRPINNRIKSNRIGT